MNKASLRRSLVGLQVVALVPAAVIAACGGSDSTGIVADGGGNTFGNLVDGSSSGSSGASSSSSGSSSGTASSSGTGGSPASGAPSTCIVGSQGCLCDTTGACAPGLTCTPQAAPRPNLCCSGSNCTATAGSIGSMCSAAAAGASCTPGITIPAAAGSNDNCGYASSTFNESTILCGINAVGGGSKPAVIQVFYSDEHALPLGCATANNPVSPLSSNPDGVSFPQTGDPACVDTVNRPLRPVLYITDITADPTCTKGDLQNGGTPYDPVAVFGTWKSATEGAGNVGAPAQADPMTNQWNLGPGADTVPASAMACMLNAGGATTGGRRGGGGGGGAQGFGAELRFEVGLISGHSYRFQAVLHDGDQTRGADSGEACALFCAGSGMACDPGVMQCPSGSSTSCPEGTICVQGCCLPPVVPPGMSSDASSNVPK